jgi:hypothetical protein
MLRQRHSTKGEFGCAGGHCMAFELRHDDASRPSDVRSYVILDGPFHFFPHQLWHRFDQTAAKQD